MVTFTFPKWYTHSCQKSLGVDEKVGPYWMVKNQPARHLFGVTFEGDRNSV